MTRLIAPNGATIIGSRETVPCIALVSSATIGPNGRLELVYSGESEMYWNDQYAVKNSDGETIVVDEAGTEYPLNLCRLADDEPAEKTS